MKNRALFITAFGLALSLVSNAAVAQTGNFGIGVSNPTSKLDVDGDARIRTLPVGSTSDNVVTTDVNGNLRQVASPLFNEVIKGQVILPPASGAADFSNHSVTTYDNADFYCISKSSTAGNQGSGVAASMTCVYEYRGAPLTSTTGVYTFVSPFNTSSYPDIFTGNMVGVVNNASGNVGSGTRTRVTLKFTRADSPFSQWAGTFGSAVLIVR